MTVYGAYLKHPDRADVEWFTTTNPLPTGQYSLRAWHPSTPNVYVAESPAALVLAIGPVLEGMEAAGQDALLTDGIRPEEGAIATDLTATLLDQLNETSAIWQHDPKWIHKLKPYHGT